jgi:hypothetical protein
MRQIHTENKAGQQKIKIKFFKQILSLSIAVPEPRVFPISAPFFS